MNKLILTNAFLLFVLVGFSQNLPKPKPNGLPSPNLRYYKPADIQVTGIRLASITKDAARSLYLVNVTLTIKNAGELASKAGKLKGFNTVGYRGIKAPNHPPMKDINDWNRNSLEACPSPWTVCYFESDMPAIAGGASIYQDCQFQMSLTSETEGAKFYFVVLADLYNSTPESNENNNYSSAIFITPPAH